MNRIRIKPEHLMDILVAANRFSILKKSGRLRILQVIIEEQTINNMMIRNHLRRRTGTDYEQSKVSSICIELASLHLVSSEKHGRRIYYSPNLENIKEVTECAQAFLFWTSTDSLGATEEE